MARLFTFIIFLSSSLFAQSPNLIDFGGSGFRNTKGKKALGSLTMKDNSFRVRSNGKLQKVKNYNNIKKRAGCCVYKFKQKGKIFIKAIRGTKVHKRLKSKSLGPIGLDGISIPKNKLGSWTVQDKTFRRGGSFKDMRRVKDMGINKGLKKNIKSFQKIKKK